MEKEESGRRTVGDAAGPTQKENENKQEGDLETENLKSKVFFHRKMDVITHYDILKQPLSIPSKPEILLFLIWTLVYDPSFLTQISFH